MVMRGTVNTFCRGSIPLDTFSKKDKQKRNFIENKRVLGRVWFMALVLKTSTSKKSREFKSHSARKYKLYSIDS